MEAHFNEVGFWAVWYCQYNGMKNHSSELIVTPVISLEGYQASKSSFSSLSCPTSLLAQDQTKHRSKCSHAHACAFFFTPSQPAGQLRGLHSPPVCRQGKAGLFVGREGAKRPPVLTGQQWLTQPLPLCGAAGELLFSLFQGKFCLASPSCVTANAVQEIFWELPLPFAFTVLKTHTSKHV